MSNSNIFYFKSIYDLIGLSDKKPAPGKGNTQNTTIQETAIVRTEKIFSKMDADKNGVITESEFINGCLQDKFLYQMLTSDYSENF